MDFKEAETFIDESGTAWRLFLFEYEMNGKKYAFELSARSFEDAEQRLKAIGQNGVVLGVIEGTVDA